MITGPETNTVFLSAILRRDKRYKECAEALTRVLKRHSIPFYFLDYTKDIWCRDYMPIQISEDDFIQFRYQPSYLEDYSQLRTDPEKICRHLGIPALQSITRLDGGNLVNWTDKAIMTDRVIDENPHRSKTCLINEIKMLLRLRDLIFIPQIASDLTGHIDGMIRFKNANTLIGNNREVMPYNWVKNLNQICRQHQLNYLDMPYYQYIDKVHPDNAIGSYINYLEVRNLIVVPAFGNQEMDDAAYDRLVSIFPEREIEMIDFKAVAREGGVLNCVSWNLKSD